MPVIPILAPRFALPKSDPDPDKWCPCQDRPVEITYKESVISWLKEEGDRVLKNDLLAEYESEKMTFQLLAPAAGKLSSIALADGDTFRFGETLGTFETDDPSATFESE